MRGIPKGTTRIRPRGSVGKRSRDTADQLAAMTRGGEGRLFNVERGEFVPSLDEYAEPLAQRSGLAGRIVETDRKLREFGIAVDRLRVSG